MKIRNGFVSNSSSSSFICDITGEEVSGYDMGLEEAEMYQCENAHTFLEEFIVGSNEEIEKELEENDEFRYSVPSRFCPICSFNYIMIEDIVAYIAKTYEITYNDVYSYMKSKNSRLRKVRPTYWLELTKEKFGLSKDDLVKEIKSKYTNFEEFYEGIS